MSSSPLKCVQLQADTKWKSTDHFFTCGRPAKFKIKGRLGRKGNEYLCGIHARAYDSIAKRTGRALATPLLTKRKVFI